ncbi:MAG: ATP-binding cassette domain-containing protein, partial [Planctomycetes bacterium]|nr:ATP-binding cassette domain-containing protein [Planctomycetota bacterium]
MTEPDATNALPEPLLSCKGISRSFPMGEGELEVLKDVDFELRQGEFVAIVGSSGAGKSTLMHILGLLDAPNAGEVIYRGKSLASLDPEKASRLRNLEFGFVFQFFHLLP